MKYLLWELQRNQSFPDRFTGAINKCFCHHIKVLIYMVPLHRFELWTYWLQISCSTNWAKAAISYMHVSCWTHMEFNTNSSTLPYLGSTLPFVFQDHLPIQQHQSTIGYNAIRFGSSVRLHNPMIQYDTRSIALAKRQIQLRYVDEFPSQTHHLIVHLPGNQQRQDQHAFA